MSFFGVGPKRSSGLGHQKIGKRSVATAAVTPQHEERWCDHTNPDSDNSFRGEVVMKQTSIVVFLVSAVASGILASPETARGESYWHRTISGWACNTLPPPANPAQNTWTVCPFMSDTLSANGASVVAPSGNSVVQIYLDINANGNNSGQVLMTACATSYNQTGGQCGYSAMITPPTAATQYDVSLPVWTGTGSEWDYFYVDMYSAGFSAGDGYYVTGLGVAGVGP
jgi:hypothetical protein